MEYPDNYLDVGKAAKTVKPSSSHELRVNAESGGYVSVGKADAKEIPEAFRGFHANKASGILFLRTGTSSYEILLRQVQVSHDRAFRPSGDKLVVGLESSVEQMLRQVTSKQELPHYMHATKNHVDGNWSLNGPKPYRQA